MENVNNKPLTVTLMDVKNDIVKIINEARLHPILAKMVLDELCEEASKSIAYTMQIEKEQYKQQQAQKEQEEVE